MKNTKEVILVTALNLFNTKGLSKVTLRSIAKKMGISQGNLNYHFKRRDEIIENLYFDLVKSIDLHLSKFQNEAVSLKLLLNLSTSIMHSFYEYRFFLLDFVQIMRENEMIKIHYKALSESRELQFQKIFNSLIAHGIIRKEILPNEYTFLYKRFQILGDFWISSAHVTSNRLSKKVIHEYANIIQQSIYPYLTAEGQTAYFNAQTSQKN